MTLFNAITIIIVAILQPCIVYLAYKVGKGDRLEPPKVAVPKIHYTEQRKLTQDEQILVNIMNYDSTAAGQKEVI